MVERERRRAYQRLRKPGALTLCLTLALCIAAVVYLAVSHTPTKSPDDALQNTYEATTGEEATTTVVTFLAGPKFLPPGQAFSKRLSVELSVVSDVGKIRYTVDGSEPTEASELYSTPLVIEETVELKAKTFWPGVAPSPTSTHGYVKISSDLLRFSSTLPIVLIETFGERIPRFRPFSTEGVEFTSAYIQIIGRGTIGRATITGAADFSGRAGIKARGSSTLGREKASFKVEIRDNNGEDRDVEILGLPAESDWVLQGPLEFDRALVRNAFVYELSNQMGRYAPRTRFVEVFLNEDGGAISGPIPRGADYFGVYVLMEKIKRGTNRVDVERLSPEDNHLPEISGGYILKIDRPDPGDSGFYVGDQRLLYVYPKESDISSSQAVWIRDYIGNFQKALYSPEFDDPEHGYANFIDVGAWIDYHIINELTKNPDSHRFSTFIHKPRSGKLTMGPVWDFDRTMGCDFDRRASNPRGWTRRFYDSWWGRLFQDRHFQQRYRHRWRQLRESQLSHQNILSIVESMALEVEEAQKRNRQRWYEFIDLPPGGWRKEVEELKQWLKRRLAWMDSTLSRG